MNDPKRAARQKEAWERVSRLTDEEVLAQFGCCVTHPDVARAILIDKYYQELVEENWMP